MRCLTTIEISDWLSRMEVPEDPYWGEPNSMHYLQFYAPPEHRRVEAFSRMFYQQIIPNSELLIHITDWVFYTPSEMLVIDAVRGSHNESRRLIDAPGHLVDQSESDLGIALFSLSASYAWKSYLYSPHLRTTLYNWDGEIFDFWTNGNQEYLAMKSLLSQFSFTETTVAEAADCKTPEAPHPPH